MPVESTYGNTPASPGPAQGFDGRGTKSADGSGRTLGPSVPGRRAPEIERQVRKPGSWRWRRSGPRLATAAFASSQKSSLRKSRRSSSTCALRRTRKPCPDRGWFAGARRKNRNWEWKSHQEKRLKPQNGRVVDLAARAFPRYRLAQFTVAPPQHVLYFLPEPQGHGSLRPILGVRWLGVWRTVGVCA